MRKSSKDARRPIAVTLPSTFVDLFDSTLRRGQSRTSLVEELMRQELVRQGIDPDSVIDPDAEKSSSEPS